MMSDWVRALGIDYGTARIGLAVSDDIGLLAHPLETVPAANLTEAAERIASIIADRQINDVVIGLPLHTNGREGDFSKTLKSHLSSETRWHEVDERYTTQMAMEKLHEAGRNEKNSRHIIDQAAAVEILQQWLDHRAPEEC